MRTRVTATKGFSLIELLVTITIIAVLTAIVVVSFQKANQNARDARRKSDLAEMKGILENYRLETGTYPDTQTGSAGGGYDISSDGTFLQNLMPNFMSRQYADPLANSSDYYYRYKKQALPGCNYELGAYLEAGQGRACPAACGVSANANYYCLTD